MPIERAAFSQAMGFLPPRPFSQCANRCGGNRKAQRPACMGQSLRMASAQLAYRESLRDIETCSRAMQHKLYHMGIRGRAARSTLADANENRDWRICADFAQMPIAQARPLCQNESLGAGLDNTVDAPGSTAINLCLSLFPWAHFRKTKGARADQLCEATCIIKVTSALAVPFTC
jgi:hypothetical protein